MNASAAPVINRPARSDPWLPRFLGIASSYLPLLMMALLAGGTWWMVKRAPLLEDMQAAAPLRHEPDYEMRNFGVQRFAAQGGLKAEIEGDVMRHYPDTDTVEIDNVRLRAIGQDGRLTLATAKQAVANGAGTEVQLLGGAQVTSEGAGGEEPLNFKGEFLHAFLDTERVRSHLPVVVTQGATQIRADGMEYDHLQRLITFNGRMRATFPPRDRAKP